MTMVPNVLISPGFSTGTCTIALLDEESIVFIGGTYPIAPYSGTMVVDKSVAIFDTKDNSWQKLQDLPSPRANHGCARVTSKTKTYFVVYGGSDGTSNLASVILYNTKQNIWETPPSYVKLPAAFSGIRNAVVLQMDEYGCNMMFMELTTYHLQICSGNFTWKSASVPYDASAGGFTLGANDLLPCGIY